MYAETFREGQREHMIQARQEPPLDLFKRNGAQKVGAVESKDECRWIFRLKEGSGKCAVHYSEHIRCSDAGDDQMTAAVTELVAGNE